MRQPVLGDLGKDVVPQAFLLSCLNWRQDGDETARSIQLSYHAPVSGLRGRDLNPRPRDYQSM